MRIQLARPQIIRPNVRFRAIACLAIAAAASTAQAAVTVVTLSDLKIAIDAAADGDLLLVPPGWYYGLQIDGKSLTIAAMNGPGSVLCDPYFYYPASIKNLAAGSRVVIEGIDFRGDKTGTQTLGGSATLLPPMKLKDNAGIVWFDQCTFGAKAYPALDASNSKSVILSNCALTAGPGYTDADLSGIRYPVAAGAALVAAQSRVFAYSTSFVGGHATGFLLSDGLGGTYYGIAPAGVGIRAGVGTGGIASELFLSDCTVQGGAGADGMNLVSQGCSGPSAGTFALVLASSTAREIGSTLTTGATGKPAAGCPSGPAPGPPVSSSSSGDFIALSGKPATLKVDGSLPGAVIQEGGPFAITVSQRNGSGGVALVLLSAAPQAQLLVPYRSGLHVAFPFVTLVVGTLDGDGNAAFGGFVPNLPPGLLGVSVFLQGAVTNGPLPDVLSSPVTVTVLDASL